MKNLRSISLTLGAVALALGLFGCDDPAKGTAKASTSEAITQTTTTTPAKGAVSYAFDGSNSKVEWVGSKVTGKHEGGFKTFTGEVRLVDGEPEKSSVEATIDTKSIFSDAEKLTQHLSSADFFDIEKNSSAKFVSTSVKKGGDKGASHTITGNLTLHGVTKAISFPATVKAADGVDVNAEFAINRKDFGIVYAGKPDDLIRDDVVIKLNIHAKKKPS